MKRRTAAQTVRALAGSAAVAGSMVMSLNAQAPQLNAPKFEAASVKRLTLAMAVRNAMWERAAEWCL